MKKNLFLAALAIAAMASCTKTELVETVNDGSRITFETFMHKATRATETTVANLGSFTVTAIDATAGKYIDQQSVTVSSGGICSDYGEYYWPTDDSQLDFFAWGGSASGDVTPGTDYWKVFTVAPAADPASQSDFVVARVQGKKSTHASTGVSFNFRHAMSQIALQVYNTNEELEFDITGWKVCGVDVDGTFTLNDASTAGTGKIASGDWSDNTTFTGAYTDDFAQTNLSGKVLLASADAISGSTTMILVPQTAGSKATAYAGTASSDALVGQYIAVEMVIKNATNDAVIAPKQWCCWPVQFAWNPGYKYTYQIDLAQGGYKECNDGYESPETTAPDEVLENSKIIFANITIDSWEEATPIDANIPTL